MNSHNDHSVLLSAGLRIDPASGQVHAGAECIRLSPVNMKVLALLLESANRVVTRTEFFDRVWKRQLVGDDVLTRSISDLRTLLGQHVDVPALIETIPKRGYRWVPPVESASTQTPVASTPLPEAHAGLPSSGSPVLYRGLLLLAGFLLVTTAVLWASDAYFAPGRIRLALLPLQGGASAERQLAGELDGLLQEQVLLSEHFEVLAFSATALHLQNPFPALAREYGVNYVIEGRVQSRAGRSRITLNLVDAQSAGVVDRIGADIDSSSDLQALSRNVVERFGTHADAH